MLNSDFISMAVRLYFMSPFFFLVLAEKQLLFSYYFLKAASAALFSYFLLQFTF
jgi:hypothetical protein